MLVTAKEIAGVDFVCHILKLFCHTVGDNDVGLLFESGEITFQARVEEGVFFHHRLVNDHFNAFRLDTLHNPLNGRRAEVI